MRHHLIAKFLSFTLFVVSLNSDALAQSVVNSSSDQPERDTKRQSDNRPAPRGKVAKLLKLVGSAVPRVDVDSSSAGPAIKVRAPFVNVNRVGTGTPGAVNVKAPFVNLNNTPSGSSTVSVKAPFVAVKKSGSANTSIKVAAPFVRVDKNTNNGTAVKVNAPFVNVNQRSAASSLRVKAPFVDVKKQ
jgi:hypothetical protein